jgi:hypothetical protein
MLGSELRFELGDALDEVVVAPGGVVRGGSSHGRVL